MKTLLWIAVLFATQTYRIELVNGGVVFSDEKPQEKENMLLYKDPKTHSWLALQKELVKKVEEVKEEPKATKPSPSKPTFHLVDKEGLQKKLKTLSSKKGRKRGVDLSKAECREGELLVTWATLDEVNVKEKKVKVSFSVANPHHRFLEELHVKFYFSDLNNPLGPFSVAYEEFSDHPFQDSVWLSVPTMLSKKIQLTRVELECHTTHTGHGH